MVRVAACALLLASCAQNPYVIGSADTDAAPSPGPSPDAGPSGDAGPGDPCDDALVCSSFEGALEDEFGTILMGSGFLDTSNEQAHSGESALYASSNSSRSRAVAVARFPAQTEGELHVRTWLYVPRDLPTEIINFLFVGDNVDDNESFEGVDFNLENDAVQVFLPLHDPSRFTSDVTVPRSTWFCFRATVGLSDGAGRVRAYVNDELALDVQGVDTVPEGGVRRLRAGIDWSSEQEAYFELYIDDLVLSTSPVSC